MAQVKRGIGTTLSGMVEGLVFVQLNGKTYMRSAPHRKKNSWTPRQVLHRKRFKAVANFCNRFKLTLITRIWSPAAQTISGYALFLKTNMPAFALDGSLADPKLLQFSTGHLAVPTHFTAQRTTADATKIAVSWYNDPYLEEIRMRDELTVISAADGVYSKPIATGLLRGPMEGLIELPEIPGIASHIYLFFVSADQKDYSESVCFEI